MTRGHSFAFAWMGRLLPAFLAGLLAVSVAVADGLAEPQQVVQRVSDGLMKVLREDRALLRDDPKYVYRLVDELFLPNVDFDGVSALVLGPYWRRASPDQREAFAHEFKNMLIRTYATAVNELSEWEIRYLPLRLQPGAKEAVVRTQIMRSGGDPIQVDYRMHQKDGRWLAYDVAVAGVSLLTNYRSTFVSLARQKGLDGLIADLSARNATRRPQS
jgi:phospholipid transport system substrate-binding protein